LSGGRFLPLHNMTMTPIGHQTEMGVACITGETATNDRRTGKIMDIDRGRDRWRDMGSMTRREGGARFQFSRGDAHIDIICPQNETLQNCVQAASQLIDKVHSLTPGPSESRQGPTPSPDNH
jgi:hypothetical protein